MRIWMYCSFGGCRWWGFGCIVVLVDVDDQDFGFVAVEFEEVGLHPVLYICDAVAGGGCDGFAGDVKLCVVGVAIMTRQSKYWHLSLMERRREESWQWKTGHDMHRRAENTEEREALGEKSGRKTELEECMTGSKGLWCLPEFNVGLKSLEDTQTLKKTLVLSKLTLDHGVYTSQSDTQIKPGAGVYVLSWNVPHNQC